MISEIFPIPDESLSLADHHKTSGFQPLNNYQEKAVRQALRRPFSLIHKEDLHTHDKKNLTLMRSCIKKTFMFTKDPSHS
jgi:hypothetical protein